MEWIKEGLKFGCTQCGKCCTGSPGFVWVDDEDIERMATHLNLRKEDFIKRYTRLVDGHLALLEHKAPYDCVFLKNGKFCQIYESRPKQCKAFPFWPENLSSLEAWKATANQCEGIDHPDAPLIPLSEILKRLRDDQ